jgi:uncharacterized membrane protein YeaQ/YmgE (transglycosylase-associated protein family)
MILAVAYYFLFGMIGSFLGGFYKKDWIYTTAVLWPIYLLFIVIACAIVLVLLPFWLFNIFGKLVSN